MKAKTNSPDPDVHAMGQLRRRQLLDSHRQRMGDADGNGFNIQLETVPLDGRVALRIAAEKNK